MDQTTLIQLFTDLLGEVPPEMEGLIYVIAVFVLLYVIDAFFSLLAGIFGVWK